MKKLKVLGICGGAGVMLYPLREFLQANIETRSDYNTPNGVQWASNFKNSTLYNESGIKFCGGIKPVLKVHDYCNVIIGHPTCGYSSNLAYSRGKKLGNAKKDDTMKLFIKGVNIVKPKIFLFENLPTLFKSLPEEEFDSKFPDYHLIKHIVPMSAFGNSQISRIRLVVIGIKKKYKKAYSSYFQLPDKENFKLKKVFELESKLAYPNEALCHIREKDSTIVCMEKGFKKLNLRQIRDIWNSKEYINRKKWDATTTGKGKMKNLPGVYRNLSDQYPLTARKQNRQFNSRGYMMTPRELARIQGVPDSFYLWYDPNQVQYSINKSRVAATKTPPFELGQWFYECLIKIVGGGGK